MDTRCEARESVAAASRRLAEEGLLIGTAGNVSLRFEGPTGAEAAVTATGVVPAALGQPRALSADQQRAVVEAAVASGCGTTRAARP